MLNLSHEEALKKQRLIVSLQNEIDNKDHKLMEMEHKHSETLALVQRVIQGLVEGVNSKERSLLEMECKYNESLDMVQKLMNERDELHHGCQKELRQMKVMNEYLKIENGYLRKQLEESKAINDQQEKNFIEEILKLKSVLQDQSHAESGGNLMLMEMEHKHKLPKMRVMTSKMNHDMECFKIEHRKLSKQLEESKAVTDQKEKNFIENIQKLKRLLQDQSHAESGSNLNAEITTFRNQLKDKMEHLELVEILNSSLVVKELQYKQEILEARNESLNSLHDMFSNRSQLGIKRLGELDPVPFQNLCSQRYSCEQWQEIAAKLCSSWEENLKDPVWHPFKRIEVNGILQEVLDENDEKLKGLRNEWGEVVYKAVANALMEIEEHNSSGRYAIPEIWNWKEGRKATLKEIIQYIVRQLKTHKRKRKY